MRLSSLAVVGAILLAAGPARSSGFVNFESGPVRPLALSADGARLFALNTPDNRLELFDLVGGVPVHVESVVVGLEPVAVAVRDAGQVWVVNHLSDSISIVDVSGSPARVIRTLLTCDEPRDIVFAGPGGSRAFVTVARRGQNCSRNARLSRSGTSRAIVEVWDSNDLGAAPGGEPMATKQLFGDTPRALATDGTTVWAAAFHSGNQTVPLGENVVCNGGVLAGPCTASGFPMPGGLPAPNTDHDGVPQPEVGLIVKLDPVSNEWRDELGRDWSAAVRFDLPDDDVFAIDATTLDRTTTWSSVGTILFNMIANPVSGRVYVSNTEAINEVRFEGFGETFGNSTVNGHLHEARITVLDGAAVLPRHLNKHIDYDLRPAPVGTKNHSLATPVEMAITADGSTLYVAAFGSAKVGVFDTAALEADTFVPSGATHVVLSGGGPAGLALDEAAERLYVLTRFDNALSVVDIATLAEIAHVPLSFNPEPQAIRAGRRFLYDAFETSSNGEASCSTCHVFGDLDALAWDLGDPDVSVAIDPLPRRIGVLPPAFPNFHGMKGPMTTQTLRGMDGHGPMHWRGDRNGGLDADSDAFDEVRAFEKFNGAFPGLVGREDPLPEDQMRAFADFILTVMPPPNPIRALDNSLDAAQQAGRDLYFGRITDTLFNCNGCHALDPTAGFFGTDGFSTFEGETQMFKIPHLRNVYQKVGMFGGLGAGSDDHMGPQIRGTGYLHDGSIDRVRNFVRAGVFDLNGQERRDLEAFMFAFDSNFAPIVGQQITRTAASDLGVDTRIDLLQARSEAGECDVVVRGTIDGEARGGLWLSGGSVQMDRASEVVADAALRAMAVLAGQELTYTCVPPGSGTRLGLDRDGDAHFDRDELDGGTDPNDAASFREPLGLARATIWPTRSKLGRVRVEGTVPAVDSSGGLSIRVSDGLGFVLDLSLDGSDCTATGAGKIRCLKRDSENKKKKLTARFVPSKEVPGELRFKIFANKHDIAASLAGPIRLEITEAAGRVLSGRNDDCVDYAAKLVCRN